MSIENPEVMQEEAFTMPTVAQSIVLHFKNLVIGKDDAKIEELKYVASKVAHIKFTETVNQSTTGAAQSCVKRDSEEYIVMVPDFGALLADMLDDIDGLNKPEVLRLQELVGKHTNDYARKLVDGAVERDEDGNIIAHTGYAQVTSENASFLLASMESLGRKAAAVSATVPTAVRDAAVESLRAFLVGQGVPERGAQIITAATKAYFSPTTVAQLNADALAKIQARIEAWYVSLEETDKEVYGRFYQRQIEKITKALNPEELEVDIF